MRKAAFVLAYAVGLIAFALLFLEVAYRLQFIDAYQPELSAFNVPAELESAGTDSRPVVLAQGDSFTAGHRSYPAVLRERFPGWRVINSGVSATGIPQALLMAPRRFERFQPDIFIYQIYVGNDLIDVAYHPDWERLSFARNVWWIFTRHFTVVPFLRNRLTQTIVAMRSKPTAEAGRAKVSDATGIDESEAFSPERYTPRAREYYGFDPTVLQDTILVQGRRVEDLQELIRGSENLLSRCVRPKCRAIVLVVPQKSQLGGAYPAREQALGAEFPLDPALRAAMLSDDYPFFVQLRKALLRPGVEVISALPALRNAEAALGRPMYYVNDDHLNPAGQSVLAELLESHLAVKR